MTLGDLLSEGEMGVAGLNLVCEGATRCTRDAGQVETQHRCNPANSGKKDDSGRTPDPIVLDFKFSLYQSSWVKVFMGKVLPM